MSANILEQYYNRFAAIYDDAAPKGLWVPNEEIRPLLPLFAKRGDAVLDAGIGTGMSAEEFLAIGCTIVGVDISAEMLAVTHKKFPQMELHQANLSGAIDSLKGRTFDVVVSIGVLEFVDSIAETLAHLNTFLKPGGYVCFTYEEYHPESRLQAWKVSECGKGIVDPIPEALSFLVHRYTPEEIQQILSSLGLLPIHQHSFVSYIKTEEKLPIYYGLVIAKKR